MRVWFAIFILFMALRLAQAYDEASARCGTTIVNHIVGVDKENGRTLYHSFGVRWQTEPSSTVIRYNHKSHAYGPIDARLAQPLSHVVDLRPGLRRIHGVATSTGYGRIT